jgi:hypothetical protein
MKSHWDRNLAALERLDPKLAARMRALPRDPSVVVDETKAGDPSLRARALDGNEVRLHSAYDPAKEAKQFIDQRAPAESDAYVLSGIGLAYHVREVAGRIVPAAWLLIVEAREELFRAALEAVDLTRIFQRERTRVFIGTDWVAFLDWLRSALDVSEAQKVTLVTYPPCVRLAAEFYEKVGAEMETAVNRRIVEVTTLVRKARDLEINAIRNLAYLPEAARIRDFEGQFRGVPGVVVASGPSLGGNLEGLKRAAGRCVIVTVGKSLRLLAANGIEPEFAAALDMDSSSKPVFEGYEIPPRTTLLYDQDSYYEIPRDYAGPKVIYESMTPIMRWAASVLGEFGTLEKGLSVAHTAFFLAQRLGLDPIILVGVDLAFPGERTHADGVTQTWGGKVDPNFPDYLEIPSVTGGTVRTMRAFLSFVTAFEVEIQRLGARVINTTPDGALIRGTENLPLDEALEKYATGEVPIAQKMDERRTSLPLFPLKDFERAADELEDAMKRNIIDRCASIDRALRQVAHLEPRNRLDAGKIHKFGRRMQADRNHVLRWPPHRYLGRLVASTALELRKISREVEAMKEREDKLGGECRYLETFSAGYRDAVEFFLKHFRDMREEMRARHGRKR